MQSFNIDCTLYSCCCIWRAAFIDFWRDNVYCCNVMSFATWNVGSPIDWITGRVNGDKKTRKTPFELVVNYSSLQKRRKNFLIAIFRFPEIISIILLLLTSDVFQKLLRWNAVERTSNSKSYNNVFNSNFSHNKAL